MSATRIPAEVFHPSVFIQEEMDARGWSREELAIRMGGDPVVNLLSIDLYFEVGPVESDLRIGDCNDFARAFNCEAAFFRNLEAAWLNGGTTPATRPEEG
jgi:hypothetical protein